MRLLKDELQKFGKKRGLQKGLEAAGVIREAEKVLATVLPRPLLDQVMVESYCEGLLKISVTSGTPLSAVNMYKHEILNGLKKKLGRARIERLRIKAPQNYLS